MESIPIHQYAAPMSARLEPPKSSKPILAPGYEVCPYLINMVWEQSFSGEDDENPYFHQCEFEQMLVYIIAHRKIRKHTDIIPM